MPVTISETREINLIELDLGNQQTRTHEVTKEIEELEDSIRINGVIHPILIAPSMVPGKFTIIAGQRRFLACQSLHLTTIPARILSEQVDEIEAVSISIAENLVRRDPVRIDMINACIKLFTHYGTIADVCTATGLPSGKVKQFLRMESLMPELKAKVLGDPKKLDQAVRAQQAAEAKSVHGLVDTQVALNYFEDLESLPPTKQKEVVSKTESNPARDSEEILEEVRTGSQGAQFTITLGPRASESLTQYASNISRHGSPSDAATEIVLDGLEAQGLSID